MKLWSDCFLGVSARRNPLGVAPCRYQCCELSGWPVGPSTPGRTCQWPSIDRASLVPVVELSPWHGTMTWHTETGSTKSIFTVQCVIWRYSYSPDLICTLLDDNLLTQVQYFCFTATEKCILNFLKYFHCSTKHWSSDGLFACSLLSHMSCCSKKLLSLSLVLSFL